MGERKKERKGEGEEWASIITFLFQHDEAFMRVFIGWYKQYVLHHCRQTCDFIA